EPTMLRNRLLNLSLATLDNQTDILRGVSTRIRTRPQIAGAPNVHGRSRKGSLLGLLALLPLAGAVTALVMTGWLPEVRRALVLLLPALAPLGLVALGVLLSGEAGVQRA